MLAHLKPFFSFLVLPTLVVLLSPSSSSSFATAAAWMGGSSPAITNPVRRHQILRKSLTTVIRTPCQSCKRRPTSLHDVWNDASFDSNYNYDVTETFNRNNNNNDDNNNNDEDYFPAASKLEMVMELHRPLGCTVDESLAPEENGARHVFVSKVAPGGFAEAAGLQVGDVIVGVTGLFGDKSNVGGLGLELVKGLVSSCPEEKPLWIRVARGTSVMERHETALVDLCTSPDSNQKQTEQCVIDFIASGYDLDTEDSVNGVIDEAIMSACSDTDTECLLDDLWSDWGEDLPPSSSSSLEPTEADKAASPARPKPWSSRSSPSGTYVRDPRTGQVRNIDA